MANIQQSQAEMAQARVNAAAIKMAQQNKGTGGYPTSSGGASSTASSTSTSSTKAATKKNSATDTSDSSDSTPSSDSSADSSGSSGATSNSTKPFNPYSSTGDGCNPYSGHCVPVAQSTLPGEKGHWVDTEMNVTCNVNNFRNSSISALLVNEPGVANCNGTFVEFLNPDKTHPFFYGFAGVVNERMEANSTRDIRWPAPYLYKDRPNPAFVARVLIRYFAAN